MSCPHERRRDATADGAARTPRGRISWRSPRNVAAGPLWLLARAGAFRTTRARSSVWVRRTPAQFDEASACCARSCASDHTCGWCSRPRTRRRWPHLQRSSPTTSPVRRRGTRAARCGASSRASIRACSSCSTTDARWTSVRSTNHRGELPLVVVARGAETERVAHVDTPLRAFGLRAAAAMLLVDASAASALAPPRQLRDLLPASPLLLRVAGAGACRASAIASAG